MLPDDLRVNIRGEEKESGGSGPGEEEEHRGNGPGIW